ncbi:hypothetical protein ACQP1W_18740 [Spirillospora sp. CA-255316]
MAENAWGPEKISGLVAQLTGFGVAELFVLDGPDGPRTEPGRVPALRPHGVGHLSMAWFLEHDAKSMREALAGIQEAVRVAPFGIGALVHNEGTSGILHVSGSQFPTAWAQAATWDPGWSSGPRP